MARLKINDLPEDTKVSKEDLKKVMGGVTLTRTYSKSFEDPIVAFSTFEVPVFREAPVLMERNEEDERTFDKTTF